MKRLFTFLSVVVFATAGFSQNALYDVRFSLDSVDCVSEEVYINIDVKAPSAANSFRIAEQNYRFSFTRSSIVPGSSEIYKENLVQFFMAENGSSGFYNDHTTTGALDTIVSYNVELAGGDGVLIENSWQNIGTLKFSLVSVDNSCLDLIWHDQGTFPPTFMSEKNSVDQLVPVVENSYTNIENICISDICNPLPVELTDFTAFDNRDECSVELSWTTATETDNDFFQIEKSTTGFDYQPIGIVEAVGNSVTTNTYTFVDRTPSIKNYYRLKQVDVNGAATISSQLVINSSCFEEGVSNSILEVFPNPATKEANFKFYNTDLGDSEVELNVLDILGQVVHVEKMQVLEGPNLLSFHTENLVPGTYMIQLRGGKWFSNVQKLVKK